MKSFFPLVRYAKSDGRFQFIKCFFMFRGLFLLIELFMMAAKNVFESFSALLNLKYSIENIILKSNSRNYKVLFLICRCGSKTAELSGADKKSPKVSV